jgi:pyruvate/2-oxoglutarate dehydrogenase complex dihydrolipoamide acyltransferase (E2) component
VLAIGRARANKFAHATQRINRVSLLGHTSHEHGLRGRHATQVLPAGTTGIVSFGRAVEQPVVRDGEIVVAPIMPISGTFDHRAMDGIEVMGVLNAIVEVIEEPALMLL